MAKKTDITLTVGVDDRLVGVDAAARRIHDEMAAISGAAGRDAGRDFSDEFSRSIRESAPKLARAYSKTVTTVSRTMELEQKLASNRELVERATAKVTAAENDLDRLRKTGTATASELLDAEDAITQAKVEHNTVLNRQITLMSQSNRATNDHMNALRSVLKVQEELANERGMSQTILSMGKFISAIRSLIIPGVAAAVATIGSNILAIGAAASQALWMLPAGAAAAAAGFGTLTLATSGFGDTIDSLVKGDLEKFAERIQKLSPNAQQAALAIQALWPSFTGLKNAAQDALFADFGPMLNQLSAQYLPIIQNLTTGIAGGMNTGIKSLFDQLMNPETQSVLTQTFDHLVATFQQLAPAIAPFTDAIARIVETGASFLPRIADAAVEAANGFANFISEAQKSGDLSRWFDEGLQTIGLLWQGIKDIGKAFVDLAPAGREYLPDIIELLKTMGNVLPPIIESAAGIIEPFGEIARAVNRMWDTISPIFDNWLTKLFGIKDAIGALMPGLQFLNNLANIADRFLPGGPSTQPIIIPNRDLTGGSGSFGTGARQPGTYRDRYGNQRDIPKPPAYPAGGYPVPPPPAEKGSGSKADEPPFFADPSLWSVDAIPVAPVDMLPNGLAAPGGLTPNAANLNNIISSLFPMLPDAGGWRPPDGFNEHSSGEAIDFMVGQNAMLGQAINDFILQNAKALGVQYTIWEGMTRYPDGSMTPNVVPGGDPTKNHFDHVHARVNPGPPVAGGIAFPGAGAGGAAAGMMGGGTVVDPEAVLRAEMSLQTAKNDVEQKRLRVLELEAKGNASQRELLTAKNDVAEAENKYRLAEINVAQARQGKYKELDGKMKSAADGLGQIGAALADDFGLSEGLPGMAKWLTTFLANLAFAPALGAMSAVAGGPAQQTGFGMLGTLGAQNIAAGKSPLGLSQPIGFPGMGMPGYGAPTVAPFGTGIPAVGAGGVPGASAMGPAPLGGGMGTPMTSLAPGAGATGAGGLGTGGLVPGLAPLPSATFGQPPHGLSAGAAPGPAQGTPMTSMSPGGAMGGGGFAGLGGLPMQAISSAAQAGGMALNAIAPGAGPIASQAAQTGIQLANRTIGYLGQLAGIGVGGLLETFLPNNSPIADPSKSWIGRLAAGFSGARPALPNTAGTPAPAQTPLPEQQQQQQGGQGGGPMVNIENMVNQTPDGGQSVANQIGRMQLSGYAAGGPR